MSRGEWIFLIVCIVNTIIAVLHFLFGALLHVPIRKSGVEEGQEMLYDNRKAYLFRCIVMILCPVVGPLFFLAGFLLYGTIFRQQVNLEDVIFSKERVKTHLKADEERERDLVPLEEALKISDQKNLRMLMLNIIRGDMQESLEVITMALDSEDSETSHYAASVLRDELNAFRSNVQKYYERIQADEENEEAEDPAETEYEELLIDYMIKILRQKVFTDLEQVRYVHILEHVCEILHEKNLTGMTPQRYEGLCLLLLELEEYERMEKWCQRLLEQYPKELASYTCRLKLYFTREDREAFLKTLQELRQSDIVIDSETLELIRIFS